MFIGAEQEAQVRSLPDNLVNLANKALQPVKALPRITAGLLLTGASIGLAPTPVSADSLPGCIPPATQKLIDRISDIAGQIMDCPFIVDGTGTTRENTYKVDAAGNVTRGTVFWNGTNQVTAWTEGGRTWEISPYDGKVKVRSNLGLFTWEGGNGPDTDYQTGAPVAAAPQPTPTPGAQIVVVPFGSVPDSAQAQPAPAPTESSSVNVSVSIQNNVGVQVGRTDANPSKTVVCPNGWQPSQGLGVCAQ